MNREQACEIWRFDPETGVFYWRVKPAKRIAVGAVAGTPDKDGYVLLCYRKRRYRAHRIAWLMVYGSYPANEIDHTNHDRADNRVANLREATRKQNAENMSTRRPGTHRGVYWFSRTSKWVAYITHHGKQRNLGYFKEYADAVVARQAAERELYTHA